jgi:hypothetical protein
VDNDDEEKTERVPNLSPGVRGYAMDAVDIIGRMQNRPFRRGKGKEEKIEWHNVMFTGETDDYISKDRDRYIPRGFMVDPTLPKVVQAMKDQGKTPDSPKKKSGKKKEKK